MVCYLLPPQQNIFKHIALPGNNSKKAKEKGVNFSLYNFFI